MGVCRRGRRFQSLPKGFAPHLIGKVIAHQPERLRAADAYLFQHGVEIMHVLQLAPAATQSGVVDVPVGLFGLPGRQRGYRLTRRLVRIEMPRDQILIGLPVARLPQIDFMYGGAVQVEELQAVAYSAAGLFRYRVTALPVIEEKPQIDVFIQHQSHGLEDGDLRKASDLFVHGMVIPGQRHHLTKRGKGFYDRPPGSGEPPDALTATAGDQLGLRNAEPFRRIAGAKHWFLGP